MDASLFHLIIILDAFEMLQINMQDRKHFPLFQNLIGKNTKPFECNSHIVISRLDVRV